ncbi:hypothetical protein [Streptomyces sp. MMBL 11-3]|uniref:hypothetical protein n=1 Tax=Streptomyces sp. MMBL 11-3 TaxID=3382639 RepID=UPI0039B68D25
MTQQTLEGPQPPHVFASYTVEPVPLFPAPDAVSHRRLVDALTEAIENGQSALPLIEMGGVATKTRTGTSTNTNTVPDSDNDSDSDSDLVADD